MPDRGLAIGGLDADAKQAAAEGKQALQYRRQGEVGPQGFAIEREALLAQHLGPEAHIPGLQVAGFGGAVAGGALAQLLQFRRGHGEGRGAQLLQQRLDTGHRVGHFGGQAELRPVGQAQPARLVAPQGEDCFDQGPVVERLCLRGFVGAVVGAVIAGVALAGGPADMGAVELLAQAPVTAVLEEGGKAGHVQAQQPGAGLGAGLGAIGGLEVGGAGRLGQLVLEAGR